MAFPAFFATRRVSERAGWAGFPQAQAVERRVVAGFLSVAGQDIRACRAFSCAEHHARHPGKHRFRCARSARTEFPWSSMSDNDRRTLLSAAKGRLDEIDMARTDSNRPAERHSALRK